jgi:hypothetical protein
VLDLKKKKKRRRRMGSGIVDIVDITIKIVILVFITYRLEAGHFLDAIIVIDCLRGIPRVCPVPKGVFVLYLVHVFHIFNFIVSVPHRCGSPRKCKWSESALS